MLDDLLKRNLVVVFCGTAAGLRSGALRQYYAGHGNQFWDVLAKTKLTPRRLAPSEYRLLLEFGIGLTDIAKDQVGNDAAITFRSADREPLRETILRFQPRYLCFNGKRAAREYFGTGAIEVGLHAERIGSTRLF